MEMLWCWRCKTEMPMLDEIEYAEIAPLFTQSIEAIKKYREETGTALKHVPFNQVTRPVRERYEQMTGVKNCHHEAIMHHRISLYGPPCKRCNKPLRTPQAKLCGACMFPVEQIGFPSESKTDTPSTSPSF